MVILSIQKEGSSNTTTMVANDPNADEAKTTTVTAFMTA
jgi:hypothetical protein